MRRVFYRARLREVRGTFSLLGALLHRCGGPCRSRRGALRCHRCILGWSDYMSEEPFEVPSIGGAFPRPKPTLLGDCEEQGEEDTRRPRRAFASVNLRGFYENYFTKLRSCEVAKLRAYEGGGMV